MKLKIVSLLLLTSSALAGCVGSSQIANEQVEVVQKPMQAKLHRLQLQEVVAARAAEDRARDMYRKPVETLSFFQVEPGMTVAEALPGGGWYSKILANYLGAQGTLYGVNYSDHMWARFGFFKPEQIKGFIAATENFPNEVSKFTDNGVKAKGFTFANVPGDVNGTVDRVRHRLRHRR